MTSVLSLSPVQIYRKEKGYNVIHEGPVIIEGTEHYVRNGYVYCNAGLNHRAWGVTEKEYRCPECFFLPTDYENKQLELFV